MENATSSVTCEFSGAPFNRCINCSSDASLELAILVDQFAPEFGDILEPRNPDTAVQVTRSLGVPFPARSSRTILWAISTMQPDRPPPSQDVAVTNNCTKVDLECARKFWSRWQHRCSLSLSKVSKYRPLCRIPADDGLGSQTQSINCWDSTMAASPQCMRIQSSGSGDVPSLLGGSSSFDSMSSSQPGRVTTFNDNGGGMGSSAQRPMKPLPPSPLPNSRSAARASAANRNHWIT